MVRLSGPRAIPIGRQLFSSTPPLGARIRHVEYGHALDAAGRAVDAGLAWALRGPRSYTGEDTVEITSHGSPVVLETLVQAAIARGAVLAGPGEFTRRAFLNGKLDLVQAEAVLEVIRAESSGALSTAYGQASGRLSERVRVAKEHVVRALAILELRLDFTEDDRQEITPGQAEEHTAQALRLSRNLIETFEACRRRLQGYMVALVGRPNVGKSTLLNSLLAEERAIVTPIPGTTRDVVEGKVVWAGEAFRLTDTAGIQETANLAEQEGVKRTRAAAASADLLLVVLDASARWEPGDDESIALLDRKPGLLVRNKTDLPTLIEIPARYAALPQIEVSALTEQGIAQLQQTILRMIPVPSLRDGTGITRQRHLEQLFITCERLQAAEQLLSDSSPECAAAELQEGLLALGAVLGENVGEDVLDRIFSEFCIGK